MKIGLTGGIASGKSMVAARLRERFDRPAFAIALAPDGSGTGSGRSVPGVDLGRAVIGAVEDGVHCWLEVFEEDEVFRPGSASAIVVVVVSVGGSGASWRGQYGLTVGHVVVDPASGMHVEDVRFVEVVGAIFVRDIDGWFAG